VLINKAAIQEPKKLAIWERLVTSKRQAELAVHPIVGGFDLPHLQRIHAYLFQDIYDWAGQIRTDTISKGNTLFCSPAFIYQQSIHLFAKLQNEKQLANLDVDHFCERAAYYLSEINILHPFREGNGRAQREFIRCLAMNGGYRIIWDLVETDTLLHATIQATFTDKANLGTVLRKCIVNDQVDPELIRFYRYWDGSS
jgi:cell filamentation protein